MTFTYSIHSVGKGRRAKKDLATATSTMHAWPMFYITTTRSKEAVEALDDV